MFRIYGGIGQIQSGICGPLQHPIRTVRRQIIMHIGEFGPLFRQSYLLCMPDSLHRNSKSRFSSHRDKPPQHLLSVWSGPAAERFCIVSIRTLRYRVCYVGSGGSKSYLGQ